jgi:hypothetical protein
MPDTVPTNPVHDEGLWISGPGGEAPPQFASAALVFEVIDVLARVGIVLQPTPGMTHVAGLAAADLLRALGVRPATAPERRNASTEPLPKIYADLFSNLDPEVAEIAGRIAKRIVDGDEDLAQLRWLADTGQISGTSGTDEV